MENIDLAQMGTHFKILLPLAVGEHLDNTSDSDNFGMTTDIVEAVKCY